MSASTPPTPHFSPQFEDETIGYWPRNVVEHDEFPPLKKPRSLEDVSVNPTHNPPSNPILPVPPINPPISKGISRMFFKTKLCAKFKLGTCPYGSNCNFAHGTEEIRKPPPNWQEIVAAHEDDRGIGNWAEQLRINKFRLCRKYYNGEGCPYGDKCNFVHEDPERFRESAVISIGTTTPSNGSGSEQIQNNAFVNSNGDGNGVNQKPAYWKTKMCHKWETTGFCPFGEKCHFAHGLTELQRSGGCQIETENGNATAVTFRKHPTNSASDIAQSKTTPSCKQQVLEKRCLLKWKGPEKISRIYADWIDDMPLFHSSPSKVES